MALKTIRKLSVMATQEHRPREETRRLILEALTSRSGALTRTQIARAIQRQKTPHLIDMIEELVDEGVLVRRVKLFGNGVQGYLYSLAERE